MSTTEFILAVDQSTSATKAMLFDVYGRVHHRVTVEHTQYYPEPGMVEHDPLEVMANTRSAIGRVATQAAAVGGVVKALAITNQRETVLAWDLESGEPFGRAIVWQDERGTSCCDRLKADGHEPEIQARTGLVLDTYFSAAKVSWLMEHDSDVASRAASGRLAVGTIDSWLIWNLTNRQVFATDVTNACRTLLFNVHDLAWDPVLIGLFGLDGIRLPEVRHSDAEYGTTKIPELGASVPIIGVCGDSHAALFGQTAFDAGECKATFGTGSSVMLNVGPEPLDPPSGVVLSLGWGAEGAVQYVFEGNVHSTGDTVRWVRDNLGLFSDYDDAERRAAALPDNGGVYLVPAFGGLGAPHWVHGIRASICGLSRASGADHVIRAALESIAYQIRDLLRRMGENEHVVMRDLRADGGSTRNRFLMQFLADVIESPVYVGAIEEISARGVAMLAGLRCGLYRDRAHLREIAGFSDSYEPEMNDVRRERLMNGWADAVTAVIGRRDAT